MRLPVAASVKERNKKTARLAGLATVNGLDDPGASVDQKTAGAGEKLKNIKFNEGSDV